MVVLKIDKTVPTPGTSPKADVIVRVASFLNLERLLVRVPLLLLFPITAFQVAGFGRSLLYWRHYSTPECTGCSLSGTQEHLIPGAARLFRGMMFSGKWGY